MKKGHLSTAALGRTADKGRNPNTQLIIQELVSAVSEGATSALEELNELKTHFELALKSSNYDEFAFANFHFEKAPDLLSAGGFNPSHNLNGKFIQNLDVTTRTQNVFFSILPDKNGFWASFLWLRKHTLMEQFVKDLEESFCSPGGMYAVALSHIENTFLRPSFWEALPKERKAAFHFLMTSDVMHRNYAGARKIAEEFVLQYPGLANQILRG